METYIKPSVTFVELRVEESLAGVGSFSVNQGKNNRINEEVFTENLVSFWMKFLRK